MQRRLARLIALLDGLLSRGVNEILHHPSFQRLEAAWRGVRFLVDAAAEDPKRVKIRVINVRWDELGRDAERAVEFDQSVFWQKVYEEEYGIAGGIPFSVLIGDYEMHPGPVEGQRMTDLEILTSISHTAGPAFVPFITGTHPSFLGVDSFGALQRRIDFNRQFQAADYEPWRRLRSEPDSKFIGLCLPHILMRAPHPDHCAIARVRRCEACDASLAIASDIAACPQCAAAINPATKAGTRELPLAFNFSEDAYDRAHYLWGNAAFAFGRLLIRAFLDCAWFADIRGFDRDIDTKGVVAGLPAPGFGLDSPEIAPRMSTDVAIDESMERGIAEQGFIPLCHCHDTPFSVFYSNNSIYRPEKYASDAATVNERLTSMLQYTLCVSRFAHYLKVLVRDAIGGVTEPSELQRRLSDWVQNYVSLDDSAKPEVKARLPLREADVQVWPDPRRPGHYRCEFRLRPHYQFDELSIAVKLMTWVRSGAA